ncbi:MAG: hypothetical protein ACP5RZ_01200 [Thermoplasmata archaeon]
MRKFIFLLFIIMLLFSSSFSLSSPVTVNVSGPSMVGANTTHEYSISVNGYFYKFGYHLLLTGENLSGLKQVEYTGISYNGHFKINITFPSMPQTVILVIMGFGYYENSTIAYSQIVKYTINVVKSIPFIVKITNPSSMWIYKVNISYYLNGQFIGNQTVNSIGPNQQENITYYYVGTINSGTNYLTVKLNSSVLKFSNYSSVYTIGFYYGQPPDYSWVWYIFAVVVIVIIFFIYMAEFSRKRRPRPKWKK